MIIPKLHCPVCFHSPHGLVAKCIRDDWDLDEDPCGCTYRRADDLLSGDAARFRNRISDNPGPWHLMLARQDGYGGNRSEALCGVHVASANRGRTQRVNDTTNLEGKTCLKCTRLAAMQETT